MPKSKTTGFGPGGATGERTNYKRLFEYKGYWIRRDEAGRAGFRKCWLEGGNVRRRKLASEKLEDACAELIRDVDARPTNANHPGHVMFAAVVHDYRHRVLIPKRKTRTNPDTNEQVVSRGSTESGFDLTVDRLVDFMKSKDSKGKPRSPNKEAFFCAELTLKNQYAFFRYLSDKFDLSTRSISIYMSTIAAALNKATKPYLKSLDGNDEEIHLLLNAPAIITDDKTISEVISKPNTRAAQVGRPLLTFEQMAGFIDAIKFEHAFRYCVIALNTWARPEAIHDLNFDQQIDLTYGLVHLNPEDRTQTKKYRPVIRLTENLRGWAEHWGETYPMQFRGKRVLSCKKPINDAFDRAGLTGYTRYELRAFMFNQSRRVLLPGHKRLQKDQRSEWIGHVNQEGSSTGAFYERFDPEFLEDAKAATDLVLKEVDKHMKVRKITPPKTISGTKNVITGRFGA